jgi:hypothetical protein
MSGQANTIQVLGAGGFGALIGWYVYYINRYRRADVQLSEIVTLVGAIGGGAVLALFPAKSVLFGAYGIGLFIGFFGYFIVLAVLVTISDNFGVDYFLDGRRKALAQGQERPGGARPQTALEGPGGGDSPIGG